MANRVVDRAARILGMAAFLAALAMESMAQRAPVDARVRAQIDLDLEHEMRVPKSGTYAEPPAAPLPFYHDSVTLTRERSRALSGMTYTWGVYRQPNTGSIRYTTLAGEAKERIMTLSTPSDWWKLATVLSWEPRGEDGAISACGEMIAYVGPRRSVSMRPLVYLGAQSLKRVDRTMRDDLKKSAVAPPVVARADGGSRYRIALWAIEAGRVAKYHCEVGSSAPMLVATDSVNGPGLSTPTQK